MYEKATVWRPVTATKEKYPVLSEVVPMFCADSITMFAPFSGKPVISSVIYPLIF